MHLQVECKRAEPRDVKLMADSGLLPAALGAGGTSSLGLLAGTSYAAIPASLATAGAMAAGYPGAFTQAYPAQGTI